MVRRSENGGQKDCAQMWFGPDFRGSLKVQAMTWAEQGMYRHLLDLAWENHGIPADLEDLRSILRLSPDEFASAWKRIGRCFEVHPDDPTRLINVRQEKERDIRADIRRKRAEAGERGRETQRENRAESANGWQTNGKRLANGLQVPLQNGGLSPSPPPSPSQGPVPLRPSDPGVLEPSSCCTSPDPQDDRSAEHGTEGRGGTPAGPPPTAVFEALVATSYRRNSAHRTRDLTVAADRLVASGIDAEDIVVLARKAVGKGKRPAGLFAHWIDHPDEARKELSKR